LRLATSMPQNAIQFRQEPVRDPLRRALRYRGPVRRRRRADAL